MQFKDIIGQEAIKQQLRLSVQEGRIPHAQLFEGAEGVGKLSLALAYAQYINCPHRTAEDSCGVCPTCLQFGRMEHPDLHFVFPVFKRDGAKATPVSDDYVDVFKSAVQADPYLSLDAWNEALDVENKQTQIYERESSEIMRKLSLKSFGNGYKVMIIWQADKMNITCANKLLKLLEEPPQGTVFLLISEHPEALLTTILSRTQHLSIPLLSDEQIAQQLQHEGLDPQSAKDLARIARGSLSRAHQLKLSNSQDAQFFSYFVDLMRNAWRVAHQQDYVALQALRQWSMDIADNKVGREQQKAFLQYAQRQIRENYIANLHNPDLNYQTAPERTFSARFAPFIHQGNVEQMMNELDKAERQIGQNGNAKIIFFDLCLQMIVLIKKKEA